MKKSFKSGFVTVTGRPNVGKSTLINALTGEHVAITSPKPQTTRKNQLAILTEKHFQIVFIDTPGLHVPKTKLGEYMVNCVDNALDSSEIIMYLYDATESSVSDANRNFCEKLAKLPNTKKLLVLTKIDLIEKDRLLPIISELTGLCEFDSVIPVSSVKKDGLKIVVDEILKYLPEGPAYYEDDITTTSTVRDMAAEIIREKVLYFTNDEVPHGVGVEIIQFKEAKRPGLATTIEATILCEKESHKGILIGKEGSMLKRIGSAARNDIENIVGGKVNLKLWVKVKDDWRNSKHMLKELGYKDEE
ncbi:MAG: GTPase Era [Clostridia bacterium]|nr:GTPase Era [Clostridia bacterium]